MRKGEKKFSCSWTMQLLIKTLFFDHQLELLPSNTFSVLQPILFSKMEESNKDADLVEAMNLTGKANQTKTIKETCIQNTFVHC